MPPDGWHWGDDVIAENPSEAEDITNTGLYLMMNYSGPGDGILLFQEVFSKWLRDPGIELGSLESIFYLVQIQLSSFDEWFCDLVYCRFFELCSQGKFRGRLRKYMKTYYWSLMSRGYQLPEAWKMPLAKKWNAEGPPIDDSRDPKDPQSS